MVNLCSSWVGRPLRTVLNGREKNSCPLRTVLDKTAHALTCLCLKSHPGMQNPEEGLAIEITSSTQTQSDSARDKAWYVPRRKHSTASPPYLDSRNRVPINVLHLLQVRLPLPVLLLCLGVFSYCLGMVDAIGDGSKQLGNILSWGETAAVTEGLQGQANGNAARAVRGRRPPVFRVLSRAGMGRRGWGQARR